MSAEVLREAAALMRERAEGATPGPWEEFGVMSQDGLERWNCVGVERDLEIEIAKLPNTPDGSCDTAHIASWHPAVALAVANLLDGLAADGWDFRHDDALTVARAYLGSNQ